MTRIASRLRPPSLAALAVASVFSAALAAGFAGCGFGPGDERGDAQVTVTRDFGRVEMYSDSVGVRESDDAIRLLTHFTDRVETAYGGGFVESVDGFGSTSSAGGRVDWFFYLDGSESPVGALEADVTPGSTLWWDRREWSAATHVPEVVGSWPRPFGTGEEVALECLMDERPVCAGISADLEAVGTEVGWGEAPKRPGLRVLVGPWEEVRKDPAAQLIARGPGVSGVFARFVARRGEWLIQSLDPFGRTRGEAVRGGLVAAVRSRGEEVVWLVTGSDTESVPRRLEREDLSRRYAVLLYGSPENPSSRGLPLE